MNHHVACDCLSILYVRFHWFKWAFCMKCLTFNSLCEIQKWMLRRLIGGHTTFNSLCEIRLSAAWLRRNVFSFNSLCEIRRWTWVAIVAKLFFLSILYVRFAEYNEILREVQEIFQFSMWDSTSSQARGSPTPLNFQFSMWDSTPLSAFKSPIVFLLSILYVRFYETIKRWDRGELNFQFSMWDSDLLGCAHS